ncbi:MAG: hypothetical protein AB2704_26015 [Candidatus Thiodiazotropha taylori]
MTNSRVTPSKACKVALNGLLSDGIVHVGTKEELIKAGLASDEMFPIWPKRVKRYIEPNAPQEKWWNIKRIKGTEFELTRYSENGAEGDTEVKYTSNIINFPRNSSADISAKRRKIKRKVKRDQNSSQLMSAREALLMWADSFEEWAEYIDDLDDMKCLEYEDIGQLRNYLRSVSENIWRWLDYEEE